MRPFRVLPVLLAVPVALALAVGSPTVRDELLPPEETIAELIAQSLEKPNPAPPVHYDLEYRWSLNGRYRLDLYEPLRRGSHGDAGAHGICSPGSSPPIVLFFHGGSWLRGDKVTILVIDRFLRRMREAGYFVAAINYTTSPLRGLAGPVQNGIDATRWIVENAGRYGYAADRLGLYGVSAGGHVALMVASTGDVPKGTIDWVFAECAPSDLVAMRNGDAFENSDAFRLFPEGRLRALSPITYVDEELPPVLLFHGDADRTVHRDQSARYAAALREAGGDVEFVEWPGGDHAFLGYPDEIWYEQETVALEWFATRFQEACR